MIQYYAKSWQEARSGLLLFNLSLFTIAVNLFMTKLRYTLKVYPPVTIEKSTVCLNYFVISPYLQLNMLSHNRKMIILKHSLDEYSLTKIMKSKTILKYINLLITGFYFITNIMFRISQVITIYYYYT